MPRIATVVALALLAVVASGCVSIKSQSAVQRLPGFVTLRLDLCVSDRDLTTYADCVPGATRPRPTTASTATTSPDADNCSSVFACPLERSRRARS